MENLLDMIFLHADSDVENGVEIDMENSYDIMEWVNECGGLKEFDYYC